MNSTINRTNAPAFKQVDNISFLDVQQSTLGNNTKIYSVNGGSQDLVKIDFIFDAGSYYQPKSLISSFTSSLIKEGSKNYTAKQIAEGIDNYGAFLQTEHNYDTAVVTLYTLNKHLEKVLPIVSDIILHPTFNENEFNIYKNNASEKFKTSSEKVSFLARQEFAKILFGENNNYGKVATSDSYNQLSKNDLIDFHNNHYSLQDCTIILSGKTTDKHHQLLNQYFGGVKSKTTTDVTFQPIAETKRTETLLFKENALQSAIRIGKIVPNQTHEDFSGLKILNTILGGYFGSRLMNNIREDKGYTYGINSGIISLQNTGYFYIGTEVGTEVTSDALKEIYKEIDILQNQLVSENELELVKNYMLGKILKSCDGPFNMASLLEDVLAYNQNFDYYNNFIERVKSINATEVRDLAQQYLGKESLIEIVAGKK
ncbi:insulinase family protein [bacterium]|nr:insulinase family protein [bacterium]